jgi:hypothetical protein
VEQAWFEMRDVRRRKFQSAVWIPLRAVHHGQRAKPSPIRQFIGEEIHAQDVIALNRRPSLLAMHRRGHAATVACLAAPISFCCFRIGVSVLTSFS